MTNFEELTQQHYKGLANSTSSQKSLSTNTSKLYNDQIDIFATNNMANLASHHLFETQFCEYIFKYLQLLQYHKNSQWLSFLFGSIK